jgi:ubiquinone/menaquinone biosynthesis C-methylase UbiE
LLKHRVIEPEILDAVSAEEAAVNLADLRRINRWFGGHYVLRRLLREQIKQNDPFTFLDVGAASGDMGRVVQQAYPQCRLISLDHQARNLSLASGHRVVGDAFALPVAAVDFVHCSLFLHHFTDDQVVDLLAKFARIARRAVLLQDLHRHPLAHRFLPLTRHLFGWQRVTLHDGPISVAAAFKARELRHLAERAGLRNVRVRSHGLSFRLSLVAGAGILKVPTAGA